jgi:hypothetical protein
MPWLKHIKDCRDLGYGILSLGTSFSKPSTKIWTYADIDNYDWQLDKVNLLVSHLWNTIIKDSKCKRLIIVAENDLCANVVKLVNSEQLKGRVNGIILVYPNESPKLRLKPGKTDWFMEVKEKNYCSYSIR